MWDALRRSLGGSEASQWLVGGAVICGTSLLLTRSIEAQQWGALGPSDGFVMSLEVHPDDSTMIFAGVTGYGVLRSFDSGRSWSEFTSGLPRQNVVSLAVDPLRPGTLWAGVNRGGLYRSTNLGASWNLVGPGLPSFTTVFDFALDTRDPSAYFLASQINGVFRSFDAGETWESAHAGISLRRADVIAMDPHDPSRLYVGLPTLGVYRSDDRGDSWTNIVTGLGNKTINTIVVDPIRAERVYVATNRGVFASDDFGDLWQDYNRGLEHLAVTDLLVDPLDPNVVYAATVRGGVYRRLGDDQPWVQVNEGLTNRTVNVLAAAQDTGRIYAGTAGRGVFAFEPGCMEPLIGDCNGDGVVTVDEVLTGISIALGDVSLLRCAAFDDNLDGDVTVDEILAALDRALTGCG